MVAHQAVAHQGFYEVGATVIPVLFLALLVQLRWFEDEERKSPRLAIFDLAIVVVAVIGEAACITVLSEDRPPTEIEKTVVIFAITLMFLPIIVRATLPLLTNLAEGWPRARSVAGFLVFGLTIAGIVLSRLGVRFIDFIAGAGMLFVIAVLLGQVIADDWEAGRLDFVKRLRQRRRGASVSDDKGPE